MAFVGGLPASGRTRQTAARCDVESPARRDFLRIAAGSALGLVGIGGFTDQAIAARPEGVNRPELLPKDYTTVIDLERFLTSGQRTRLEGEIARLEEKTSVKLRVLTQRYPQTPGLAIRDFWSIDDKSVVLVADYFGGTGSLLKFNVGEDVYNTLPPRFWSLLASKFGSQFYVRKNGEDGCILDAINTIKGCLNQGGCETPP